jgi:zinc protease
MMQIKTAMPIRTRLSGEYGIIQFRSEGLRLCAPRAFLRLVAYISILLCTVLPSAALEIKLAEKTFTNGLKVVVIPDRRSQVVTHSIWYKVGAADEVNGKTGLAHFLEHLMFKGTTKYPYGEFDRLLDVNGAQGNAFTTQDYTAYYQRTIKERLPLMMELEADRMLNLVLHEDIVLPELQVVNEERRQRIESEAGGALMEESEAALFLPHPYGRPTIGYPDEVSKLSLADALAFYKNYYRPANAVVIVAGDVDPEWVFSVANKHYGALASAPASKPLPRGEAGKGRKTDRLKKIDGRAAAPSFTRTYVAPSYANEKNLEVVSLDFFATWLGSGVKSQLHQKLVLEQKIATSAGAWFSGSDRDIGRFSVYAIPNPGVKIADIEAAVDKALAEALNKPVPQADIDRVRKQAEAELVYALDNQMSLVRAVGSTVMSGKPAIEAFDISNWSKVTPESIAAAVAPVITPGNSVTSILLPQEE